MSTETDALQQALTCEYAAVYAYGLLAAHGAEGWRTMIADQTASHRVRRDATIDALHAAGVTPQPPQAAYTPPHPVTDPASAAQLGVTVETDTTMAWRSVAEKAASPTTRQASTDALAESAVRLARWRGLAGQTPSSTAFPGQPAG